MHQGDLSLKQQGVLPAADTVISHRNTLTGTDGALIRPVSEASITSSTAVCIFLYPSFHALFIYLFGGDQLVSSGQQLRGAYS